MGSLCLAQQFVGQPMHLALFQNPTNAADEKFNKHFSDGPSVAHQVGTRQGHERRKTSAIIDELLAVERLKKTRAVSFFACTRSWLRSYCGSSLK
jgi:hypothetical protein